MNFLIVYLVFCTFTVNRISSSNKTKAPEQDSESYCSHPDCSLRDQHTMCAAAGKQSPRLYTSGITPWMRYQLLLLHNRHRDNIAMGLEPGQPPAANMRKMYWDFELEETAELWARQCQKRHDECRNTIRFNVLQNMDVRPVVTRVTEAQILADAVGAWFSGSRLLEPESVFSFRLSNCSGPGGCNAHWYSAAAWASTWRLGCSQALCTVQRDSCALFRRRRRYLPTSPEAPNCTTTQRSTANILRRTKLASPPQRRRLEDFSNDVMKGGRESPLHRGVMDYVKNHKQRERKILAFTVCNYGPAGNIEGFPIYQAGQHCANCPEGTWCVDKTHRALCTVLGDPEVSNRT